MIIFSETIHSEVILWLCNPADKELVCRGRTDLLIFLLYSFIFYILFIVLRYSSGLIFSVSIQATMLKLAVAFDKDV